MRVGACLPSLSRLSHAPTPIQKVLLPALLYNLLGDVISVISVKCGAKTALQRRLYSAASRAATCMGVGASESPGSGDKCPPLIFRFQVDVAVAEFKIQIRKKRWGFTIRIAT